MYMTQGHFIYSLLAYAIIVKMLKDGNVFDTGHFINLPHAYAIITKILRDGNVFDTGSFSSIRCSHMQ